MISFFANKKYKVIPIVEFMEGDIPLEYGISPSNNLLFSAIVFFYKQPPNESTEIDLDKLERGEYNT
jgi:hypothetical protein